jgi:uncharacterized protein YqeY
MRTRLRQALRAAIKARDRTTTRALRSALSAIENAEATEFIHDPQVATGSEYIAGSTAGLGAAEVERRVLSDSDVHALIQAQVDERLLATQEYQRCGRGDLAIQLRAEADVLRQYLHPSQ